MMMCRALLTHDARDLFATEDEVRGVLERLVLSAAGVEEPDRSYITTTLGNLLDQGRFTPSQVLFRAEDREAAEAAVMDPLVEQIWFESLVLVFRLLAQLPRFSFAAHHGDVDQKNPGSLVGAVVEDLDRILARTRIELLGRQVRGREVSAVCDGLLEGLNARLYGEETPR
jgi:hypothetical protein